ncbi:heme-containing dehydratase protein [Aspergillus cavernicola]|uniref:Heme-containing dehydratase protein n=1 Tax=Aspergillus cavernicola TaxID=176166 RepID=A0ABR4I3I9_9EURO
MWGIKFPSNIPIVTSLFGIQRLPSNDNTDLIDTFNTLITPHARHIEHLEQDTPIPTRLWLAYWPSRADFQKWWSSDPVSSFWSSVPDDAGIYREIMEVPPGRTQHGTNIADRLSGMAHLGKFESILDKSGYWGCYYDRMPDVTKENTFPSEVEKKPSRIVPEIGNTSTLPIRKGRVNLHSLPDNIAFVVEGQDHSLISPDEKAHWFAHFDQSVTNWISDLVAAGPERGILDSRLCYVPESGMYRAPDAQPRALNFNRKVQLFYFLDMAAMESIGRQNVGHVKLRREFLGSYGPGGVVSEGKLCLWVEASILKGSDVECEYVGCVEGTGLMGLNWD